MSSRTVLQNIWHQLVYEWRNSPIICCQSHSVVAIVSNQLTGAGNKLRINKQKRKERSLMLNI